MLVVISAMVSAGSMGTADDNAARVAVQKFRHWERSTAEKAPAANSPYFLREDGLMLEARGAAATRRIRHRMLVRSPLREPE
jgi:hypothetical protein